MSQILDIYQQLYASSSNNFNTCFYCGCISTTNDLVPPLKYASFYITTREDADFYRLPACNECYELLKADKSALLTTRFDNLKRKLRKKYSKAIQVYELWDETEVNELDYNLRKSVLAGLELGEEAYSRWRYKGFEFEIQGSRQALTDIKTESLSVFGDTFYSFRDALDHASRAYQIPKAKLKELFIEHHNSFDDAINHYHKEMEKKLFQKELKELCNDFAKKHKQNSKFVMRAVEIYLSQTPNLTIRKALVKLYEERVKKWETSS